MIDTAQAVLLLVVVVLAALLVVLGVQVFFILKEIRYTITKANKVLEDAGNITESVSRPIATVSTLLAGLKTGSAVAGFINRKKGFFGKVFGGDDEDEDEEEETNGRKSR